MNRFSESAPRPPVFPGMAGCFDFYGGSVKIYGIVLFMILLLLSTGEENVPQSQVKMDSWASRFARRGPSHPSTLSPTKGSSPILTPRRHGTHHQSMDENDSARRYEPAEGSASTSPPLVETPPYLRWAENLHFLLADPDGVDLFEKFLDQENCSHLLKVKSLSIVHLCVCVEIIDLFHFALRTVLVRLRRPETPMDRGSGQSRPNHSSHSQKVY